jgi:ABC-type sugar transport system ATPase subunit
MNLVLKELTKQFGDLVAVDNLSLDIEDGEIVSLLGPSGCGKTTTLNMISGFERPNHGKVYFNGKCVNDIPPRERNVGMVFQEYAIFTTMNAYENIAFGLRVRKVKKKQIEREVLEIAESLNLQDTLYRNINKLNLSELQRIALARTLSTKPSLMLLDEPLSNLDAALRERTRVELKHFHDRWGITMIYVTHDQIEAISLANRIAVMKEGKLQQFDNAQTIYREPANVFIAQFIGSPPSNIIRGEMMRKNGSIIFHRGNLSIDITAFKASLCERVRDAKLVIGIRPEHIAVSKTKNTKTAQAAEVYAVEPLGFETILDLRLDDTFIRALIETEYSAKVGERMYFDVAVDEMNIFDAETERNLRGKG